MRRRNSRAAFILMGTAGLALFSGCAGNPSEANIELRKQNQQLQARVQDLDRRHAADEATIRGLQAQSTTVPQLPESQLDQLFTTEGIKFGNLTGGYHPDPNQYGDTMLKVYVVPVDQEGDKLKAAGSFHIDLFDLSLGSKSHLGSWDFDLEKTKSLWYGAGLLYTYVLDCPWQTPPVNPKLTMRISFTDALTHRVFTVDRDVTVQPPAK